MTSTSRTAWTALSADHRATVRVDARQPFAWSHSLRFICGFPATQNEQLVDGEQLTKAWRVADDTVVTAIRPADGGRALELDLASTGELTDEVRDAVVDRVSFYLSLDDDLEAFDRAARSDPAFAPVADRLRGYHQVKFASPLENLVWSILAQRNPMSVARENKSRLMTQLNQPVQAFGSTLVPFPALEQLAALSQTDLAEIIRNERKGKYLFGTIQRLIDIDEDYLRHGDYREVRETLLGLPGIGPWSAVFVLIRGLGRMEVVPQDAEILAATRKVYGAGITEDDLVNLAAPYAPNQGYWAHYLRVVG
jgi:DNA-3-methyladenine glycosylase II